MRTIVIRLLLSATLGFGFISVAQAITPEQIIAALKRPENSTGNIADAPFFGDGVNTGEQ